MRIGTRDVLTAAAMLLVALSVSARAQTTLTADKLYDACTRADTHWVDFCNGYFQAASDLIVTGQRACIPDGTSRTALVELYESKAPGLFARSPALRQ